MSLTWHGTASPTRGWRDCHRADGRPKKLYGSSMVALRDARAIEERDGTCPMRVYWCEREQGWHVGGVHEHE